MNALARHLLSTRSGWLRLLALTLVIYACVGGSPYKINLMPAPAVFEDGKIDPLPKGSPPVSYDDHYIFYATDRKPTENQEDRPYYLDDAGFILRLGQARVKAGPPGMDWQAVHQISLAKNRGVDYPLEVLSVNETGVLPSTYSFQTRSIPESPAAEQDGRKFSELVNERLAASGVKEIYIYVPGFKVPFTLPVLIASEFWHFLGYRGAFISYNWPTTPSVFAYLSDLEGAVIMARKLRLFLTYLAEETQAEKIHIIAYSAGSRLVVRALGQLALLESDATTEEIRKNFRIGNVIIVGADISHEEFGAYLSDGLLRIPERTSIYVSSSDRALVWARRLFRRDRLGQMWGDDLPQRTANFIGANPSLQFIDVTGAAGSTAGNGHNYFRQSPWVSSDLIALLAYDIGAAQRGLEREANLLVWKFPPDFIQRLRKALAEMNPDWVGAENKAGNLMGANN